MKRLDGGGPKNSGKMSNVTHSPARWQGILKNLEFTSKKALNLASWGGLKTRTKRKSQLEGAAGLKGSSVTPSSFKIRQTK